MTFNQLAQMIRDQYSSINQRQAKKIISLVFHRMSETLIQGGRVEIRGFGAFTIRERKARKGHNPRTGERVNVPAKTVAFFKAGKLIKEQINQL